MRHSSNTFCNEITWWPAQALLCSCSSVRVLCIVFMNTQFRVCVCACVLLGLVLQFPAPAGGLEEHQEAKLCAAGNVMCTQAPWEKPLVPRQPPIVSAFAITVPGSAAGICTRVTDDSMTQLIRPRGGNDALLHVTNCSLGLSFGLFQCRKELGSTGWFCERNWFSY